MKAAIVIAMLLCVYMLNAMADTANCSDDAALARNIMELRQTGYPVEQLYAEQTGDLGRAMVIAAYKRPSYRTESFRNSAVEEFVNDMFLVCVNVESRE